MTHPYPSKEDQTQEYLDQIAGLEADKTQLKAEVERLRHEIYELKRDLRAMADWDDRF